ncbi:uncharacterized protein LOC136070849 [Quercus suber]|uniref:uncharacterized protein LOC136070849 n=1 Tax=Quercus suber TaxID=58331 RepID=UPI0032DEFBFA
MLESCVSWREQQEHAVRDRPLTKDLGANQSGCFKGSKTVHSGVEIMYPDLYKGLKLKLENLACYDSPSVGFDGKIVILKGQIRLPVQVGSEVVEVEFIMVDAYSPYTAIMERPWLDAMGAIYSTLHLKIEGESLASTKKDLKQSRRTSLSTDVVVEGEKCEDLEKIVVDDDKEKFFQVRVQLSPREKKELVVFLRKNVDVFAWSAYEAPRVDPNFICHHLNVNPSVTPKKQPSWRFSKEHSDTVKEEVIKFKWAGAIKEVFYLEWLANTVVVKKKNGKWRVCVDFTDLNKTCPKDPFPIPWID